MKTTLPCLTALALVPAAILALTSCASKPEGQGATLVAAQKGVPGGVLVETFQITATVTDVDSANRKVTLVTPNGKKTTFKAGPEVVNFPQIQVGDQVKATVVEQIVAFMRSSRAPAVDGEAAAVALAPVGAKPGVLLANTVQVTVTVKAIDVKAHKATLLFPDNTSQTFKARPDVDLTKINLGEEVVIRTTEACAITVEKP